MNDFTIGDWVEIVCHDGARFSGLIDGWDEHCVYINWRGFPCEDIRVMQHG